MYPTVLIKYHSTHQMSSHPHRAVSPKPASKAPAPSLFNQMLGSDDEDEGSALLSQHGNQQTQAPDDIREGDANLDSESGSSSSSGEDDITSTQDYGLGNDEDMGDNVTVATQSKSKGKGYIPSLNVTPVPKTSSITRISKASSAGRVKRAKGARFDAKRQSQFSSRIFGLLKAKLQIEKGVNFKKTEAVPKIFAAQLTVIYKALMESILQSKKKHVLSALLNSENVLCKVAGSKRKRVYWNKQALLKTLSRSYKGRNITVSDVRDAIKHGGITNPYFARIEMPVGKSSVQTVVKTKKELLTADREERAIKKLEYKQKCLAEEIALQKQPSKKGKKGGDGDASASRKTSSSSKNKQAKVSPSSAAATKKSKKTSGTSSTKKKTLL